MRTSRTLAIVALLSILAAGSYSILPAENTQAFQQLGGFLQELIQKLQGYNTHIPEDRVYLHADKPFYKPGETIWFTTYVRGAELQPSEKSDIVYVELINPKGNAEQKHTLIVKKGAAQGDFTLSEEAVGGLYKLKVYTNWQKNEKNPAYFEKEIQVQAVVLPRLKMNLDFVREAYGAGDRVAADLKLETNSNEPLANYAFNYVASLNGKTLIKQPSVTDEKGEAQIKFDLPESLKTSDGLLNVMIDYQGIMESISRSVPIVLNNIQLSLFPEGGDLVEGLKGRVAFKALNEFGKPADIEGSLIDENGTELTTFSSYHQGMGAFSFTPQPNQAYKVKITKPVGVEATFDIPEPMPKGYSLTVSKLDKDNIYMYVYSTEEEKMSVIATVRGKHYFATTLPVKKGQNLLTIPMADFPIGVAQVTLFDSKNIERAERLVFVNKHKKLNIELKTNKQKYLPREKVQLTVKVTDERGMPMPANLSLAVTNDQLLSFADDKSSNILSWLLVEADLRGKVEEPNFYFDPKEEKAEQALDYLLMTAGWRRYTWQQVLDEERPNLSFSAEKTEIGGVIYDYYYGGPVKNATIKLGSTGESTQTDVNGRFDFRKVDLTDAVTLNITAPGHTDASYSVAGYNSNINIGMYRNEPILVDEEDDDLEEAIPDGNLDMVEIRADPPMPVAAMPPVEAIPIKPDNAVFAAAPPAQVKPRPKKNRSNLAKEGKGKANEGPAVAPKIEKQRKQIEEQKVMIEMERRDERAEKEVKRDFANNEDKAVLDDLKKEMAKVERELEPMKEEIKELPVIAEDEEVLEEEPMEAGDLAQGLVVFDDRLAKPMKANRQLAAGVTFYRAKEFAAPVYQGPQSKVVERTDFRSTIYWNGNVEIDRKGKAVLSFYTSDEITSFRITAEGMTKQGMLGRAEEVFYSQLPFSMSAKAPVEIVTEDILKLPLTLVNNTNQSINGKLKLTMPEGLSPLASIPTNITLTPNKANTFYLEYKVKPQAKGGLIKAEFKAAGFADAFSQNFKVVPKGFPVNASFSGSDLSGKYTVNVDNLVEGSMDVFLTAYPSSLSELMSGLESIFREPYGCFEQTSSSTYPNILALTYMQETDQENAEVTKKALGYIKRGYGRLMSYESPSGGFEWFGGDPGHEGLTAYGLMEFVDMQKVYDGVDAKMIDRTKEWLLSRRDGKGGFKRNPRALHQFGLADEATMNAYIVFGLSEAGIKDLKKEVDASYNAAMESKNPYQLGLVANALLNYKDKSRADKALAELLRLQTDKGNWTHKSNHRSAPGTSGQSLIIETASLALSAMIKGKSADFQAIQSTAKFIQDSRSGHGGFGNTQSTVLALRALIEYAKFSKKTDSEGTIEIYANGKKIGSQFYEKGRQDVIEIKGLEKHVKAGKTNFEVKFAGTDAPLPYSLAVNWHTSLPNSSKDCVIDLDTKLASKNIKLGETVRLTTTIQNKTEEGQPMTLAIVGLPAGLSAQPWQLKELQEKGTFDYYEVIGNNVVFYYRQMKPSEERIVNLDLKADIPGKFEAPASSAYLYYTNEHKDWEALASVTIKE